jgi:hypothetical protein
MQRQSHFQDLLRPIASLLLGALAGCHYASDSSSGSPEPTEKFVASNVQIEGIERMQTVARVVSNNCRTVQFETDRRRAAQSQISNALVPLAAALPGGLKFEVVSLDIRMRCLGSECISGATLAALVTGKDKRGNAVRVETSKEASASADPTILCKEAMPAVTTSVDRALGLALADVSERLSSQAAVTSR